MLRLMSPSGSHCCCSSDEGGVLQLVCVSRDPSACLKRLRAPGASTDCFPFVQAVCILKQEKPDWDTAKRVLSDTGFMKSLLEFDKDNIPDAVIKRLKKWVPLPCALMVLACISRGLQQSTAAQLPICCSIWLLGDGDSQQWLTCVCRYMDAPEFNPEAVAKQSRAAQSLCMWARAMDTYNRVSKVGSERGTVLCPLAAELPDFPGRCLQFCCAWLQAVAPKRAKLANAQAQLAEANASLQAKQQALQVSVLPHVSVLFCFRLWNATTSFLKAQASRNNTSDKTGCSHLLI